MKRQATGTSSSSWVWLWNWKFLRLVLMGALVTSLVTAFVLGLSLSYSTSKTRGNGLSAVQDLRFSQNLNLLPPTPMSHSANGGAERLAVIVPFRERFEELMTFAPYMHRFLNVQSVPHHIFIINQVDSFRFNRAALINVGFRQAMMTTTPSSNFSYFAMHDVDLLPLNSDLPYGFPGEGVAVHVASLHPKYNYPSFIGGILLLTKKDFEKVDGMSNLYWGWGMEDDEFYVRLKQASIQVRRTDNLSTGRKDTFRHIHSPKIRRRDMTKCFDQWERTRKRDRLTGLSNVSYTLLSIVDMTIEEAPLTIVNVQLHCDKDLSPWCNCPNDNATSSSSPSQKKQSPKKLKRSVVRST